MSELKNPTDIARETLRRLTVRHLPPTPANYQACYNEIANLPNIPQFPDASLRQLASSLVAHNKRQESQLDLLGAAIGQRSWQGVTDALIGFAQGGASEAPAPASTAVPTVLPPASALALARFIEALLPSFGSDNPRALAMAADLVTMLKQPQVEIVAIQAALGTLTHHVRSVLEEQLEVRDSLLALLHLLIENVGELSEDDRWLKGQIDGLLASITPPLTLRHLDEMERRMRDVIEKQARAKVRSVAAQQELRHMLAEFVESLALINQSSSEFEAKIEESARNIEKVTSADELKVLLDGVLSATHAMVEESASSRTQLKSLQTKVEATEAELLQLHQELDSASALARHDPLTDALNRKGLDEALLREISSMRRKETPLSVSLLDIDNFKKLNDSLGHDVGDGALIHLADVARRHIRPSDTLARYGGEEFVILMPDTVLGDGIEVITRLQRELTKAIFMAGSDRVLITFSAGVAQVEPEESGGDALRRADQAMYLAKRAGKNRVMGG
ncbi:GGDEF domain-containing protein [Dechloromonas sp. XY25]|uniref:diguanylate cyclase n=1 Tax=Dechloromonas hankyongensis TaxID=2908002 RepID=A0ABS9JX58_9RHOO|nr:GGDEF domain-containing protein [Dechloromonas hankyongensis]MCG2575483.1 GGDEF domain-containing protein [Dechloromonas hankyongensis]